ncbi:uncharacterized protein CCR75_001502 [Bremia lactucae]|uniref:FYVE-type domain-containing protein n=1 Tax=Bremia lactucae TaxID=4779 RepID=A0A976FG65_BRELC|nr:hypothetical protein CCR75_001502 [Bremia lactucae]
MKHRLVSERERRQLIQESNEIYRKTHERLYNAKKRKVGVTETTKNLVTTLDTFTVYGSLDSVMELFLNETKKLVLDFSATRDIVVLEPTTWQRPQVCTSLRWSFSHSPHWFFVNDQDFCHLDIMKPYTTENGRRGWAKVSHSIQHELCPTVQEPSHPFPVHRAELFYSGLFFEETETMGLLRTTVFYNLKNDTTRTVVLSRLQNSRMKRFGTLLNHYLKRAHMIQHSKSLLLTKALQLQAERRCTACTNQLPVWKSKDQCVLCGLCLCDKCRDIVVRNYDVQGVTKGQVTCFSCSERRGMKTGYTTISPHEVRRWMAKPPQQLRTEFQGGLPYESISSITNEEDSEWFGDDPPKRLQRHSEDMIQRTTKFTPNETLFLPTDHVEQQRRRCNTRIERSNSRQTLDPRFLVRQYSRATGNSKLSSRALPIGCNPSMRSSRPEPLSIHEKQSINEPTDTGLVRVSCEKRYKSTTARSSFSKSLMEQQMETLNQGHKVKGTPNSQSSCSSARLSAPVVTSARLQLGMTNVARYSNINPCDLSYLSTFK